MGGRGFGHEQVRVAQLVNIIIVKLPNLEMTPQGFANPERDIAKLNRISGLPKKLKH